MSDQSESDQDPKEDDGRDETEAERLDRNYGELLQELRVAQTGVQILFAFLLGIAFQQRFTSLGRFEHGLYFVTLVSAAAAAVLLIAPTAAHRLLFRRRHKDELVQLTSHYAAGGLVFLAVAILSAVALVLAFVSSPVVAAAVSAVLAIIVLTTWVVLPVIDRRRPDSY